MNKNIVALDYLRAFVTVLVLAHHSFIAYVSFAPSAVKAFASKPYLWEALPVVDSQRWTGFDVFILLNDAFFMSLMFLLAGLFVWPSLSRKGFKGYLHGRFLRLVLPFAVAVVFLSPLAYYPSYLLSGGDPAAAAYFQQWFSLDFWSPGPCWFVAALFGFDLLAVLLHKFSPGSIETLGRLCSGAARRPARFLVGLIGISLIAYLTMCSAFGSSRWFTFGPFIIQASRALLYPMYFFAGVGIGVWGIERGLLVRDGLLARRWPMWLGAAVFAFVLYLFFLIQIKALGSAPSLALLEMKNVAFVLSCGATSFFLLALFVRFVNRRIGILDSLSANAYGMYLVHYSFVTWTQYELLGAKLPAIQKGLAVFFVTLLLSWGAIAGIRLIPFIGRILSNGARSISAGQM